MTEDKYNGWCNRETWAFKLWINNDYETLKYWENEARITDTLSELAEKLHKDIRLMLGDIGSIWRVDYYEVAKALKEGVEGT